MEAKVDIRKLQLLNDRINQTIDALNQVRLSVYGLQHTAGLGAQSGIGGFGYGVGQNPGFGTQNYGFAPQNVGFAGQNFGFGTPFGPFGGLSHTTGIGLNPMTYAAQLQQQNPFVGIQGLGYGQMGQQQVPWNIAAGWQGISHTSPEVETLRAAQTFPYAFSQVSPFGIGIW
jgi:hypothetical protein